jgi:hypothetical protein
MSSAKQVQSINRTKSLRTTLSTKHARTKQRHPTSWVTSWPRAPTARRCCRGWSSSCGRTGCVRLSTTSCPGKASVRPPNGLPGKVSRARSSWRSGDIPAVRPIAENRHPRQKVSTDDRCEAPAPAVVWFGGRRGPDRSSMAVRRTAGPRVWSTVHQVRGSDTMPPVRLFLCACSSSRGTASSSLGNRLTMRPKTSHSSIRARLAPMQ